MASLVQLAPGEVHVVFPRTSMQHWFDVRGHGVPQRTTPASLNCTLLATLWSPDDDPESREEEPLPEPELLGFDPLDPPPELAASSSALPPSSSSAKPPVFLFPHPATEPPASAPAPARSAARSPIPFHTRPAPLIEWRAYQVACSGRVPVFFHAPRHAATNLPRAF